MKKRHREPTGNLLAQLQAHLWIKALVAAGGCWVVRFFSKQFIHPKNNWDILKSSMFIPTSAVVSSFTRVENFWSGFVQWPEFKVFCMVPRRILKTCDKYTRYMNRTYVYETIKTNKVCCSQCMIVDGFHILGQKKTRYLYVYVYVDVAVDVDVNVNVYVCCVVLCCVMLCYVMYMYIRVYIYTCFF